MRKMPLTFAQREIWRQLQLSPDRAGLCQLARCVDIVGRLEQADFISAVSAVVESTSALRLRIRGKPTDLYQEVPHYSVGQTDFLDLSRELDAEQSLVTWLGAQESRPIELDDETYLRSTLIRLSQERWCWYHVHHHVAIDDAGIQLFEERVAEQYTRSCAGGPTSLPSDVEHYAADVADDQSYRASDQYERDRAYWAEAVQFTPTRIGKRATGRSSHALYSSTRTLSVRDALQALLQRSLEIETPFPQVLSAAALVFVHYLSQQNEVCVGMAIGPDVIPVSIPIDPSLGASHALRAVCIPLQRALEHRRFFSARAPRLPAGGARESASRPGVVINVSRVPEALRFGEARANSRVTAQRYPNDMTLSMLVDRKGESVTLELSGNASWHERWELESYLASFEHVVVAAFSEGERALNDFTYASSDQVETTLRWARGAAFRSGVLCAHDMFARAAAQWPDSVAVRDGKRKITYAELDGWSTAVATSLRSGGVRPNDAVVVCMGRSIEAIVALLAILKAGGAYVPVDVNSPLERLRQLLAECNPRAVLLREGINGLDVPAGASVLVLDELWVAASFAQPLPERLGEGATSPESLAYIIFTSGSTGTPKGVMIEHRTLANYLHWRHEHFGTSAAEVFVQKAPLSFDMSITEILIPLTAGATLVLAVAGEEKDPVRLAELIEAHGVTCISLIPSMLSAMTPLWERRCASVRNVLCGGETVPVEVVTAFQSTVGGRCRLHNVYGPTETTLVVSSYEFEDRFAQLSSPIGKPAALAELYVLSERHQPVPIGCVGQLYVGGECLARGYLNNSQLTQQSFATISIEGRPKRLYRTGDFARWLEHGNLEFRGRTDEQVKLRGFRIELGEIERQLVRSADVREACVIVHGDHDSDGRLVAFVVLAEPDPCREIVRRTQELATWLRGRLPDHMLPTLIVPVDALPRNPNGKVARNALPLHLVRFEPGTNEYVEPVGPVEKELAEIWKSTLGLDRVSRTADFFEIGGTSLSAVRAMAATQARFRTEISVAMLMERSTVSELAVWVSQCLQEHDL